MPTLLEELPPATSADPAARRQRTVLLFESAGQMYALPIDELAEIAPMAHSARPPGSPAFLAGLLDLGGRITPVVDLGRLFGGPATEMGFYTPLLILRGAAAEGSPLALLVERTIRIQDVAAEAVLALGDGNSFNACAVGLTQVDGQTALLLSTDRLLLAEERGRLAVLAEAEQARRDRLAEVEP